MDYSLPGSSVHGISQVRMGLPFLASGDLPDPGLKTMSLASSELAGGFFTTVPLGKPYIYVYRYRYRYTYIYIHTHTHIRVHAQKIS